MDRSVGIDGEGRARIEAAVRAAEATTRGEIVVAVVRSCDEYGSAGWRLGMLMALGAGLGIGLMAPALPLTAFIGAQCAGLLAGHLLARLDPLRRVFVSDEHLELAARRRAAAAFAEHGLRLTEGRTGILLLVALFEHRVVVLADEGVNRRLDPGQTWDEVVALVLSGIQRGDLTEGIVQAVGRCGEILAHPLPPQDEPRNEIAHALVIED